MSNITNDKLKIALEHYFVSGGASGLTVETAERYKRKARQLFPDWMAFMETTTAIKANYNDYEMKLLARGGRIVPTLTKKVDFSGTTVNVGFWTDSHFGSVYNKRYIWDAFVKETRDCEMLVCAGDVTEGMNLSRIDQVYELSHIGYEAQKNEAVERLEEVDADKPVYMVDGNHDRWYKRHGAWIVRDIAETLTARGRPVHYLGEDEGHLKIKGAEVWLWHGEDGSSYAFSYRIQKIVESLSGGAKPNVLLCGHTHKAIYLFPRNIHCISGGALTTQSRWMRGKRQENHTGFWKVKLTVDNRGVNACEMKFFPFYE